MHEHTRAWTHMHMHRSSFIGYPLLALEPFYGSRQLPLLLLQPRRLPALFSTCTLASTSAPILPLYYCIYLYAFLLAL